VRPAGILRCDAGSDIRILGDVDGDRAPDFEIMVKGIAELGVGDFIL
jgi:hypothetical protein